MTFLTNPPWLPFRVRFMARASISLREGWAWKSKVSMVFNWESCFLETSFGGPAFPINQLSFGQTQEVGGIVRALLAADRSHAGVVALKGRQFQGL